MGIRSKEYSENKGFVGMPISLVGFTVFAAIVGALVLGVALVVTKGALPGVKQMIFAIRCYITGGLA